VRGLNTLIATVSTAQAAPVVVAQRLRKGQAGSARGAHRLVRDALATVARVGSSGRVLVRADSAFYAHTVIGAAVRAAEVSVTVRLDPKVKKAVSAIGDDAWTTIEYPNPVYDEDTDTWVSRAEVAEVPFVAFGSKPKAQRVAGRLVVRRIPDLNAPGQGAPCSTRGDSTRSSPPPATRTPTPSPRTRPTVGTRSSSRCTPT
jgi:hypothetical protein